MTRECTITADLMEDGSNVVKIGPACVVAPDVRQVNSLECTRSQRSP